MTAIEFPASGFGSTPHIPQGSGGNGAAQFASALRLSMAQWRNDTLGALLSASAGKESVPGQNALDALIDAGKASDSLASTLSADGRNLSLFNPDAAYAMMTVINGKDTDFKAEFAEMSDMKAWLATMQQSTGDLGAVSAASTTEDIAARLQSFADAYNGWINRFAPNLAPGGLLAGTQAAQVSQWELEQSVENMFNGARDGVRGMRELGLTIDPVSNLASIDRSRLDATLAGNKDGAVAAINEFSANFARAAELLTSAGNFVPNRLDNLGRAIAYIDDNRLSLRAEFGLGDAARPNPQVAKALNAYESMRRIGA